ncbi:MAG: YdiY family protein [Thiohalobacterales bacterium]
MKRAACALLTLSMALLLITGNSLADELVMNDGSRLFGEVVKKENGTLEFKTTYAGVIKVKWAEVSELHTDEPMQLMLDDESTRTAQQIRNTEGGIYLDDNIETDLSEPSLAQSELAFINPDPWRTGEGYKLDGNINLALKKERGNTDKDEIDIDGNLTWRSRHDRFRLFGEFERDRSNNKKIKDKWKQRTSYDHFFTKQWYAGAFLGFEHDQFADLNLRAVVGPKVGYQWFESRDMNLSTEAGPLYVDEDFDTAEDNDYPALGWAINFDKFLFEDFMQFYHRQTGLWNLDDTDKVVWDTWTGLRFPLAIGFVASTEMQFEYDGNAPSDKDEVDTTYRFKLGYQW